MKNMIGFKENKIVNLSNVSNILLDERNNRVVFNLSNSIKIFNNKFTPDYVYWRYDTDEELQSIVELIESSEIDWIMPIEAGQHYISTDHIATITTDSNNSLRVIFNLNSSVTHPKDPEKVISDFVFHDFKDPNNYKDFIEYISSNIKK